MNKRQEAGEGKEEEEEGEEENGKTKGDGGASDIRYGQAAAEGRAWLVV